MGRDVLENFEAVKLKGSGWALSEVTHLEITFAKLEAGKAGHYVHLPDHLRLKHALVSMQNKDDQCFKWAVTRVLNLVAKNPQRVTKLLRDQADALNWEGIDFPIKVSEEVFATFEKNNNVGLCIYACGEVDGKPSVYTMRAPGKLFGKVVSLFLHKLVEGEAVEYHFCVVTVCLLF